MSHVQLQVRPRRMRCAASCEPPPFSFTAAAASAPRSRPTGIGLAVYAPLRAMRILFLLVGGVIDATFFLFAITLWCTLHLTVWSFAFQMGPAADCFGLTCPGWIQTKLVLGCIALTVVSFASARILRRLGHRATSMAMLVLVTFDISALMLLGVRSWT